MLNLFYHSRLASISVVLDPTFARLYPERNEDSSQKRNQRFEAPISSPAFGSDMHEALLILRLLPRYLNLFNSDDSRTSEVVSFTIQVERELSNLLKSLFITEGRKKEVLRTFRM